AGKAAGAPVPDMLSFLRGGVVSGHVIASGDRHDHDATGLKKFENVSSPERYKRASYPSVFGQNYLPQIILGSFLLILGVLIGFRTKNFGGKIFCTVSS
ncbi:hypothetical protein OM373_002641, partial [Salmonella enterica subsp. arizonae serovar 35:z4,z32:-]|nr:hypothetical protein [Salmonella enterica subsp. arizonae serovar 35:z4,z32:-]